MSGPLPGNPFVGLRPFGRDDSRYFWFSGNLRGLLAV